MFVRRGQKRKFRKVSTNNPGIEEHIEWRLLRKSRSLRALSVFFRWNPQFFESEYLGNGCCIIDGSNLCHRLWTAKGDSDFLHDEAAYANVVHNFFDSLEMSKVTPIVFFERGAASNVSCTYERWIAPMNWLRDPSSPMTGQSMQCRYVFGEIVSELGIKMLYKDQADSLSTLARHLNAHVMAGSNEYFLEDLPKGLIYSAMNDEFFKALAHGPAQPRVKVFRIGLLIEAFKRERGELMNPLVFYQVDLLLRLDDSFIFKTFVKKCPLFVDHHAHTQALKLNCFSRKWDCSRIQIYFGLLARRTPREATSFILSLIHPRHRDILRELFMGSQLKLVYRGSRLPRLLLDQCRSIYIFNSEYLRSMVNCRVFGNRPGHMQEVLLSSLESHDEITESEGRHVIGVGAPGDDSDSSESTGSDVTTSSDEEEEDGKEGGFPTWFGELLEAECFSGHRCTKFLRMVRIISDGFFVSTFFKQDPKRISTNSCSVHIRQITYGIILGGRIPHKFRKAPYIQELLCKDGELFESHVPVRRTIPVSVKSADAMEIPTLNSMNGIRVPERRRMFVAALIGDPEWSERNDIGGSKCEYNLVLLKAWARSPGMRRIDVVALLLSIVEAQDNFRVSGDVFPDPVHIRHAPALSRIPRSGSLLDLRLLHAFGQLQSMLEDACYLHAALNCPFGRRIERIRYCLSERGFYQWRSHLQNLRSDLGRLSFVTGLFDCESLGNFLALVNLLFDEADALYRVEPEILPFSELGDQIHRAHAVCEEFDGGVSADLKGVFMPPRLLKYGGMMISRRGWGFGRGDNIS